ncbi:MULTISPECIES: hypothetical protein [Actinoplanes]|uniref:hypothetical protein n=1 Tax=Actinoplanes TaxID=1865 RepID=UPI0005F2B19F|nr:MULTISPECIES: hypothetical protein [Actinoplanes]GLY06907.1 hypothetical protein Acsp01_72860 [Actinoplanes sp. NBRC 101535]
MTVFTCHGCDAVLTVPLSRVALPIQSRRRYANPFDDTLMAHGTYAADPDRGVAVAPGDVHGTIIVPVADGYGCCGVAGAGTPNLLCEACRTPVATRVDDCGEWQVVWLHAEATRPVGDDVAPVLTWDELVATRPGLPPVDEPGWWNPIWQAAAGHALAYLLAHSGGRPIELPGGVLSEVFRPALDVLHPQPSSPSTPCTVALAGPGRSAPEADIVLVPWHPQTGEVWDAGPGPRVAPLPWEIWAYPAYHPSRRSLQAQRTGPGPLTASRLFTPDGDLFGYALSTLQTQAPQPWLRPILERALASPWSRPF